MNYFEENEKNDLRKLFELNEKAHIFQEVTPSKV